MSGRHTSQHLARELEGLLKAFSIEKKVWFFLFTQKSTDTTLDKILTIVCDNTSNNDTMIEALNLEGFRGAKSRIRCFLHILNLAVKVS